jgi:hypothetical protein
MKQQLQVFLKGIEKKTQQRGKCSVVAFTSYSPKEGVSYVIQSLGMEISKRLGKRTLIADSERLSQIDIMKYGEITHYCYQTDVPGLWSLPSAEDADEEVVKADENDAVYLKAYGSCPGDLTFNNLQTLRYVFDYVLLDCPAITVSDEISFLIPDTDGVMVVVEADQTKREHILNAQKVIERADGDLYGFILNKRQYNVPGWIYNRL